ncbi:MAG TPA: class I SAM-dependent methyltransferase [Polyangia bacterium]|jgi:ubiquinone/menaquinone biosynthesis C-methylase UbiE
MTLGSSLALRLAPPRGLRHACRRFAPGALVRGALARAAAVRRTAFYGAAATALLRLSVPPTDFEPRLAAAAARDAYDLHVRVLGRPGMRAMLRRAEREDLATLPAFAVLAPVDFARVQRKRRHGLERLPVSPPDDFAYPEYYLTDFHNQANGGLSLRAALTYEWQIRFLFFGTNRLMRQGVVDAIPRGDFLDVLDVGCGTGAWITQARLQGRRHHVTGIDLSPAYLAVARFFRGRSATFAQMNAERLPAAWSDRFDLVTSIWLFHELPATAVERTTAEIARVLRPGGRLVFMDAVQREDTPDQGALTRQSRRFHTHFNEPYFLEYLERDLGALFARHGLTIEKTEKWYTSKLIVARKEVAS